MAFTTGNIAVSDEMPHWIYTVRITRESPPQVENRTMARVYVRSITRSTMYQKLHFVSRNWRMEN